jgi:hypothetical protein
VPIADLIKLPYFIEWGSLIYARVQQSNIKGPSPWSIDNTVAAKILTKPDAPLLLINVADITLATQIGLSWTIGVKDGGAPVEDYRVTMYDPEKSAYGIIQSGITVPVTTFTATGLKAGLVYKFKVQSQNDYGFSDYSNEVLILAAQKPSAPTAPVTSISGLNVKIAWDPVSYNGSPIQGYLIYIKEHETQNYYIDSTNCNGVEDADVISKRECFVPINILRS